MGRGPRGAAGSARSERLRRPDQCGDRAGHPAERLDLCVRAFGCTPREADIVRLVARGLDTASIAAELRDRAAAVIFAFDHGLVRPGVPHEPAEPQEGRCD